MRKRTLGHLATLVGGIAGVTAVAALPAAATTSTGPSTTTAPYVLPVATGVDIQSIFTVSDAGAAGNGYEMAGIPDGLGAYKSGSSIHVLMNQELSGSVGTVRKHGQVGAFVADLKVDARTGAVTAGEDLIDKGPVRYFDYLTDTYSRSPNGNGQNLTTAKPFPAYPAAFNRFCSGTLTDGGQLFNPTTGRGYNSRIWFANEEGGDESRTFGVTLAGTAYQLPKLGLGSWENTLAAHNTSDTTFVLSNEDGPSDGSQIHAYVGTKTATGTPVDKAGLTNGTKSVVRVGGGALNDAGIRAAIAASPTSSVRFDLVANDWRRNGTEQNAEAKTTGANFNRVEDGFWDPTNKNVFYFVTTQGGVGTTGSGVTLRDGGGLWRMTYDDVENPALGGSLELLLDGSEAIGLNKPDNITIDRDGGVILIQEDPGGNNHVARIVAYRISDGDTASLAAFDPALFDPAVAIPSPLTIDEETSGIIDVTGTGWVSGGGFFDKDVSQGGLFLFDAQVHTASGLDNPTTQVERGQLLALAVSDWGSVFPGPVS